MAVAEKHFGVPGLWHKYSQCVQAHGSCGTSTRSVSRDGGADGARNNRAPRLLAIVGFGRQGCHAFRWLEAGAATRTVSRAVALGLEIFRV
jgi:hypothetical protein